jgi:class 3 adenylate cyclase/DNA-binding SARP family transcriptional activator
MDFRILGSLEVLTGGRTLSLGGRQRALLAFFLLHANEVVASERLIDALWGERPPETAQAALQVHVSHLRKALGAERIETQTPGYLFRLGRHELDASRFEALVAEGHVDEALALWRGPALADFRYEPWAQAESARLDELQIAAVEQRVEAELAAGRHAQAVSGLEGLVREQPLRERLRAQLMLALYRCGRQADALAVYQETRRLLVEELGIEPGPALQQLYRQILNQDPALATPQGEGAEPVPPVEPREERKLVTVLFCDLVGFTSRAERLDPEDVSALLSRYHLRLRAELERFGGTVEKFVGDAVLALFGAPVAHEDDAERAVRAALTIRDWIAESQDELQVRFGLTTGEALVRLDASPAEGEAMVVGDVVNSAARLQQAAPDGAVLVAEPTYRATRARVTYERVDPVAVKGKSDPVPVWLAKGVRAPGEADAERPTTTLVGRSDELALLEGTYSRSVHEASAQLVTIIGEPGIGKTRLLTEFGARLDAHGDEVLVRRGRCLAYGDGITFWALGQIVKEQAGILESDSPKVAAEKLGAAVAAVAGDPERHWLSARLGPLVGAVGDQGAAAEVAEAFAAWRRFLEALAARQPLVLLIEDLHWADAALLEFLGGLVEWVAEVPLLVVVAARPELYERAPGWGGGQRNATTIALAPLSDGETSALVTELLPDAVLPRETERLLLERAGGNPLYAEEFARMLGDRGLLVRHHGYLELATGAEIPVPESLRAVIAARLDMLSLERKQLVQTAAVVGKVFWAGALASIARIPKEAVLAGLHELGRKELVRRVRNSTVEDDVEYLFWHVLVRDVAYAQIPRADRARKHVAAAEWLERVAGDLAYAGIPRRERAAKHRETAEWIESRSPDDDVAELVAHHYESALELERAVRLETDELVERTTEALWRAGERARRVYANAEAAEYLRRALALLDDAAAADPDWLMELRPVVSESLGDVLMLAGRQDQAAAAFAQAEIRVPEHDRVRRARLLRKQGQSRSLQWRSEEAEGLLAAAETALGKPPSSRAWWEERCEIGCSFLGLRYFTAPLELLQDSLATYRPIVERHGTPRQRAYVLGCMGTASLRAERYVTGEESLGYMRASLAAARASGDVGGIAEQRFVLGFALLWAWRLDEAEVELSEALAVAERLGLTTLLTRCLTYLTILQRRRDDVTGGRRFAELALHAAETAHMEEYVAQARANLAWVAWREGDDGRAAELARQAWSGWDGYLQRVWAWSPVFPLLGLALRAGRLDEAGDLAEVLLDPTRQGLPPAVDEPLRAGRLTEAAAHAADYGYL